MDGIDLQTIGIGAIAVIVIVDKVLAQLKTRGIDIQQMSADITMIKSEIVEHDMSSQVNELHKWHDVVDSDGVRRWYSRPSLEKAILRLCDTLDKMDNRVADFENLLKRRNADG